jgi:hypothetical protein
MPGSQTTPNRAEARDIASARVAFHVKDRVSVRNTNHFRGSMAGLCVPRTTLRCRPHGRLRMPRGHCGSLLLSVQWTCTTYSSPVLPAHPVNGPHLAADSSVIALVWFTVSSEPEVKLAFSNDGGSSFTAPLRIDEGNAVGRTQVVLLPASTLAFWIENQSGAARLMGRSVQNNKTLDAPFELAHGSGLGYPHAVRAGEGAFITWAEERPNSRIHVAVLEYKPI